MTARINTISHWTIRIAASLILLNGLFWTAFGIACEWGNPLGMLMHTLVPGLPMVGFGLACWRWPVAGGSVLTLWGASPLLLLVGSKPFFNYPGNWLSLAPLLIYWLPLLLGLALITAEIYRRRTDER